MASAIALTTAGAAPMSGGAPMRQADASEQPPAGLQPGDALLLHDPQDSEPFWNRLQAVRWPEDPDAFDAERWDEAEAAYKDIVAKAPDTADATKAKVELAALLAVAVHIGHRHADDARRREGIDDLLQKGL